MTIATMTGPSSDIERSAALSPGWARRSLTGVRIASTPHADRWLTALAEMIRERCHAVAARILDPSCGPEEGSRLLDELDGLIEDAGLVAAMLAVKVSA